MRCSLFMSDTRIARARRNIEAYSKGYRAGRRGRTDAENPYENDSREARAWIMGLLDGRQHQLTVVRRN
jgi:ribosome modulation factor